VLKDLLARLLYASRLLGIYHRFRNRHALTVISLHRVIDEADSRWQTCDPLYTLSSRLFEQCLEFMAAHYSVVSLEQVEKAKLVSRSLPARPLLITFDDGWADNFDYAMQALARRRLPATLFVAASAIDTRESFFQERIIAAWRTRRLRAEDLSRLWDLAAEGDRAPENPCDEEQVRNLIGILQALDPARRQSVLEQFADQLDDDTRQMLNRDELLSLRENGFSIGTHGKHHEPMTAARDLDDELQGARDLVGEALGIEASEIRTLSFPFSRTNSIIVKRANDLGYRLLFGGGQSLTPVGSGVPGALSRVGITASEISDANGNLLKHLLAVQLFRRPHRKLAIDQG